MNEHDVTDFEAGVIERSREVPVLCDFWAPWCGPCRAFGPLLEQAAFEADGRWILAKLNVEDHPEVSDRFRITGILLERPTFRDGDAVRLQRALIQFLGIRHPLSRRHYPAYSGAASLI